MDPIVQEKLAQNGLIKSWLIDQRYISRRIAWAGKNPNLLARELQEMQQGFPYFYLTTSDAANLVQGRFFCRQCGDLISCFEGGFKCVACDTEQRPESDPLLGYVGQLPSLIGSIANGNLGEQGTVAHGRPYLKRIHEQLTQMSEEKKTKLIGKFFLAGHQGQVYFSPPVFAFFSESWPRERPHILVNREYFQVLYGHSRYSYSDFHAYGSGANLLELCNYSSWHTVSLRTVLIQRMVPKVIIDLMIADLLAVGKLEKVVNNLGTDVHGVYNWIGKPGRSERFKREYKKFVRID